MAEKTLNELEQLATTDLENDLAVIAKDRAHYEALVAACDEREKAAREKHAPLIAEKLRKAKVLAADEHVDAVAIEGGKVTLTIATTAEREAAKAAKEKAK